MTHKRSITNNDINLDDVDSDFEFIKQVPVHPHDRLAWNSKKRSKRIKKDGEIEFIKQTPVHPRDRLKRKIKQRPKNKRNRQNTYRNANWQTICKKEK